MENTAEKTIIRANTEKYQRAKAASGAMSQHNGDAVAQTLAGLPLESVLAIANRMTSTDLSAKYTHLNVGQQRMNLGNRIRGTVAKINKSITKAMDALAVFEALTDEAKAGKEAPVVPAMTGGEVLAAVAAEYVTAARAAAEAEAEAAAELKAKKEAEAKAKAEAKAAEAQKETPADEAAAE